MARSNAVWGIDVGQCALKALKCRASDEPKKITIEAFDYIEYPKILTQPDADPAELIADALKQFLSRNSLRGDRVAISLSGQSGLARFIKLPPVETKKIPDIVRYEARQQIPFDLNDVIWDFQRMGGGSEEEGFVLETEIGLFAIKRDVVFRALEPFQHAGIEVDVVQLTPLTLYNFVLFDQLPNLPPPEEFDPENPPESVAVISLGTDATDLVVTNGYRVWQRSVPIGGSHFTKALTKDLKLTFAKAEHLKRNATAAQDPKAVFQAMRPVFNDLLTELDRSLHHFSNIDRTAKIGRVIGLGNAFKLPGLRKYLSQSMGQEIEKIDCFPGMTGTEVMATPAFKENILSFGVCYGLALQALNKSGLKTNLLPREIRRDRLIREKKPWAVAIAATVLLGLSVSYFAYSLALNTTNPESWGAAESAASSVSASSQDLKKRAQEAATSFESTKQIGDHLVSNVESRNRWLELTQALDQALPQYRPQSPPPTKISDREQLLLTNIECQQVEELSGWWSWVSSQTSWFQPPPTEAQATTPPVAPAAGTPAPAPATPAPAAPAPDAPAPAAKPVAADPRVTVMPVLATITPGTLLAQAVPPLGTVPGEATADEETKPATEGPSGPGFLVQIAGYHYHNDPNNPKNSGSEYVRNTLIRNLALGTVQLPAPDGKNKETFTMKELGVSYPVLIDPKRVYVEVINLPGPERGDSGGREGGRGGESPRVGPDGKADAGEKLELSRFDFRVVFVWKPTSASQRHAAKSAPKPAN